MKIALVCPYNVFEHAGGVQQQVVDLFDRLTKRGHVVKIITPKPAGYQEEVPPNYILMGTSQRVRAGMATAGDLALELDGDEIQTVLDNEKFDVIHFHEPWMPILARQILQRSSAAHVGTFHAAMDDTIVAKSIVNMLTPFGRGITEKLHVITAVSPAAAAVLNSKGQDSSIVKNLKYIPNGIDLHSFHPLKKRTPLSGAKTKTIVYVGRLEGRKGVIWLVRAFAKLAQEMPDVHLIIAGKGHLRDQLEQFVKSQEIPRVTFAGFVTDEHKLKLMGNADLVCSPALFGESFGIVPLEAMALGVPLIAGRNPGYASVLTGHGRLCLVDPKATDDFADRLAIFLSDAQVRTNFINWELDEAKKYDYEKVVDMYLGAYKDAIQLANAQRAKELKEKNAKKSRKIINRLFVRRQPRQ